MINIKEIKALYKIFQDTEVGEIEIQDEGKRFSLTMGGSAAPAPVAAAPVSSSKPAAKSASADTSLPDNVNELTSNWVGFFTRLNPKSGEYYIKLRDEVKAGQVIAHVRVLGVLQDIVADVDGKVKEILVEEGQPIEYGQPVMRFEI